MYEDIIAWLEVNLWNFLYSAAALVVIYAAYRALMAEGLGLEQAG